jgi:hypothetical protein
MVILFLLPLALLWLATNGRPDATPAPATADDGPPGKYPFPWTGDGEYDPDDDDE